ncbi:MAG: glycerol-3-phosphate acyltransferase [Clostridia bacterium]|nr:glycerol-3-phosphate acyltransferase [Clostridia bacterium]
MQELSLSNLWYWFVLMAAVCYLIGSINFATLVSKIKRQDIRKEGSGNPGTMNMFRTFGWKIGLLTFFLDAFKGGIPAVISYFIFRGFYFEGTQVLISDFTRYLCGVCVIIGHIFPCFMHFKGGKGIASTLGLFWLCMGCEQPYFLLVGLGLLILVVLYIAFTYWGSMGSLLGVTGFSIWQGTVFYLRYVNSLTGGYVIALYALILLLNVLTWVAHKENIKRLLSGEEHYTVVIKRKKKD